MTNAIGIIRSSVTGVLKFWVGVFFLTTLNCAAVAAGPPALSACQYAATNTPACSAARGDRAEGWRGQSRAEVMGQHGIVTTSQPLAAQAGLDILKRGGNAIDAAVAAAAVLNVVEPMNVGIGGDLFAIVYSARDHKLYALNASGMAPSGITRKHLAKLGYRVDAKNWGPGSGMPSAGILTVTVPGAVWGWDAVLKRFGSMSFKQVLAPAVQYAEEGFPVSQRVARDWRLPSALPLRKCCTAIDPDAVAAWYVDGRPPALGDVFRNPDLAKAFRSLQDKGADSFYRGEIAKAIVDKSKRLGGSITARDLADYHGEWVEPVKTTYHGYTVFELPPPSQAWAALEILNILESCVPIWSAGKSLASLGPRDPRYWHFMVEAKKLAYRDLLRFNADPRFSRIPLDTLLSKTYARSLCGLVSPDRASATGKPAAAGPGGDTIVLSVADADGNMVAWVNSNFAGFGSGITVPGFGFVLHNRGALFSLDPKSPNVVAPHKRPFNTLSAGFVMDGESPLMTLLLMGGDMQAQGHAQTVVNIFDLGANIQMATDMARFRHDQLSNELMIEREAFDLIGQRLAEMGHDVRSADGDWMGGFQAIMIQPPSPGKAAPDDKPVYRAGSDHRKDGQAVAW